MNEVVQNPEKVGTAFRTMSMRIRGAKVELEEAGESTEGMVESTARLQERLLALTGVDIMLDKDTFKSTYDIMDEIAQKWEHLTDIQQSSVIEIVAGRHHGNTFAAIMNNFQQARNAYETALNSEGSAWREQQQYMKGIQYSLDRMRATFQEFSEVAIGSDMIKGLVDGGQQFLEILTQIIDKAGMLPVLLGGFGLARGLKNIGNVNLRETSFRDLIGLGKKEEPIKLNINASKAELDATKKLTVSKKKLKGITSKLSASKVAGSKASLVWAAGMKKAKVAAAALGKSLLIMGKAIWPLAAIALAIKAISFAHNKFVESQTRVTRALESVHGYADRYNSAKIEVETLSSELDKIKSQIDELNAKPSLTIIEQAELNKLTRASDEIERQLTIARRLAEAERNNALNHFDRALNSNMTAIDLRNLARDGGYTSTLDNPFRELHKHSIDAGDGTLIHDENFSERAERANNRFQNSTMIDNLNYAIEDYNEAREKLTEAEKELAKKDNIRNRNAVRDASDVVDNNRRQMENLRDELRAVAESVGDFDNLSQSQQETLNLIFNAIEDSLNVYLSPEETLLNNLERFVNDPSKRNTMAYLKDLIRSGEGLTAEDLESLNIDFEQLPFNAEQLAKFLHEAADAVDRISPDAYQELLDSLSLGDDFIGPVHEDFTSTIRDLADEVKELELTDTEWRLALEGSGIVEGEEKVLALRDAVLRAGWAWEDFEAHFQSDGGFIVEVPDFDPSQIADSFEDVSNRAKNSISTVVTAMNALDNQMTGRSLSFDTFTSLASEMENIHTAVEYVNGSFQLNRERTLELVDAYHQQERAYQSHQKALAQSRYIRNAQELQELNATLRRGRLDANEFESAHERIGYLMADQSAIQSQIAGHNLLIASLDETTNAYNRWLAVKGQPIGITDMLRDSIDAFSAIRNVWDETHESFGRIGNETYRAAVEWMIPDHISHTDGEAINAYLDSIAHFFRFNENGEKVGMDIANFFDAAVEHGLAEINDGNYVINPDVRMDDFVEKLGMPLGLIRAFFREMQDFGGEFSWLDESIKTVGDLRVSAHRGAAMLSEEYDISFNLDFSDIENAGERMKAMIAETERVSDIREALIGIDADEAQIAAVNAIIIDLINQMQMLERPAIMNIDTSQLDNEDLAQSVDLLQQFQMAINEREQQLAVGADTSEVEMRIADLIAQIEDSGAGIKLDVDFGGYSEENILAGITGALNDKPFLVSIGIGENAFEEYDPNDLSATVNMTVDSSAVDRWIPPVKVGTVRYTPVVSGSLPDIGALTGRAPRVNGNAHLSGSAHANGNWGTSRTERALVGELGQELMVTGNRWQTIGDRGAEFVNVPKGAIIFNHRQTEEIFRNGFVTSGGGRGSSYAFGNAYSGGSSIVMGGISVSNAQRSSGNIGASSFANTTAQAKQTINSANNATRAVNSAQRSTGDALKALSEYFDFVEIRLAVLERATRRAERIIRHATSLAQAQQRTTDTITTVQAQMQAAREAYLRYTRHSQDYARRAGLSTTLQNQVINGTIDIQHLSEDDRTRVNEFKQWHDKAQGALDLLEDLKDKEIELARQRLDNIVDFNNAIKGVRDSIMELNDARLNLSHALGNSAIDRNVVDLIQASLRQQEAVYNQSLQKLTDYQNEFNSLVRQGYINQGSIAYHEGREKINQLTTASVNAATALIELEDRLRQIEFDRLQQLIDGFARGIERLRNGQSLAEARDEFVGRDVLQRQIDEQSRSINANRNLRNAKLREQALYNVNSERFQALAKEIAQIDSDIYGSLIEIERIRDQIFAAEFFNFDKHVREMNDFINEIDSFRRLLNSEAFFDRSGAMTESGLANVFLIGQGMATAKQQVANYTAGIQKLDAMLRNGLISTAEYEERQREFLNAIRDSVGTVDDYRNELINLYKTQMQNENRALQDNIRLRREALRNMRDYHDFANRVRVQTRDVNALRAQAEALRGVNNASAAAELRRIEAQLRDAEETLENTQREREFELKIRGLDRIASDLDDALEDMMYSIVHSVERQEQVIADMLNNVVRMYGDAFGKISDIIDRTGIVGSNNFNLTVNNASTQQGTQNVANNAQTPQNQVRPDNVVNGINTSNTTNSNHTAIERELATAPNTTNRLVAELTLSRASVSVQEGGSVALPSVNIRPTDARNKNVTWTSSDTSVATVSGGSVRGVRPGSATLTATATDGSGVSARCTVSVTPRPVPPPPPPPPAPSQQNTAPRVPTVGQQVTFANGRFFHTSAGGNPSGNFNLGGRVHVTRIVPGASMPYHISLGSRLGDRDLGWLRLDQLSGFARGGISGNELAFFDEEGLGSEIMITPGGALMQMQAGTNIFNKAQTSALHELADREVASSNISNGVGSSLNLAKQNVANVSVHFDNLLNVEGNVDKDALPELKDLLEKSYKYTSQKLHDELKKLK